MPFPHKNDTRRKHFNDILQSVKDQIGFSEGQLKSLTYNIYKDSIPPYDIVINYTLLMQIKNILESLISNDMTYDKSVNIDNTKSIGYFNISPEYNKSIITTTGLPQSYTFWFNIGNTTSGGKSIKKYNKSIKNVTYKNKKLKYGH